MSIETSTDDSTGSTTELVRELADLLPGGTVVTDADIVEVYRQDWSMDPAAGTPLAVVRARTEDDVCAVLRFASRHRIPVVPRGAGSSVVGGSTAVDGAITLSVELLDDIRVDRDAMAAVVGPGAVNAAVSAAAAAEGLFYPPDPTSSDFCSVGGNVATNSGGANGYKYGSTRDYVLGLRVVLADGSVVEVGGAAPKSSTGLSLAGLFVGSEGTLGVITRVTVRLLPAPSAPHTVAAFFTDHNAAFAAAAAIAHRLRPSELVLMDRPALEVADSLLQMGLDSETGAVVYAYSDAGAGAKGEIALMVELCREHGATEVFDTDDRTQGEMVSRPRTAVFEVLEGHCAMVVEDYVLPPAALGEFLSTVHEVAAQTGQQILTYAYPADGVIHPIITFDPADGGSAGRAFGVRARLTEVVPELGGAVAGEYGVGADKRQAVAGVAGEGAVALQRRIKDLFDPDGILNPRALLFPGPGERS